MKRRAREQEETWDEGLPPRLAAKRRERRARARQERGERRQRAEALLAELLARPEAERRGLLQAARFHEPALFDLLLERAQAALLNDAHRAGELIDAALGLGWVLLESPANEAWLEADGPALALCLSGAWRRLMGDVQGAESAFADASRWCLMPAARAQFCRSAALLHVDAGRFEVAAALLRQARRRFGECGQEREEAVCRALLGLVQMEEGEVLSALPLLEQACQRAAELEPWLAAASELARAGIYALTERRQEARAARERASAFYGQVRNEQAALALYHMEGRVAAWTGAWEDAAQLFDGVRRKWIAVNRLPEATLASIELALVLVALGRPTKVGDLVAELLLGFQALGNEPALEYALDAVSCLAIDALAGRVGPVIWCSLGPALRSAFRLKGFPPHPIPCT